MVDAIGSIPGDWRFRGLKAVLASAYVFVPGTIFATYRDAPLLRLEKFELESIQRSVWTVPGWKTGEVDFRAFVPSAVLLLVWPLFLRGITELGLVLLTSRAARSQDEPLSSSSALLRLPGGLTYVYEGSTRAFSLDRVRHGDRGTVTLPLASHWDFRGPRTVAVAALLALVWVAPRFFRDAIAGVDVLFFWIGFHGILGLLTIADVASLWSLRLIRVRMVEDCAVLDDAEPAEPPAFVMPLFGWRRDLARLVWDRVMLGRVDPESAK